MFRARPLPAVILAALAVAGTPGYAFAQDAGGQSIPLAVAPLGADTGESSLPGVIPQPTPDNPGMTLGVTLGELYTNNIHLAARGGAKQGSWVTQIQPFFRSAVGSSRFSGTLDFKLTGYLYTGGNASHQLAQDLDAQGTYAVIPQHLFVTGTALYGRQIINDALSSAAGTFFLDNNMANVASANLSPYWLQDLGNVGELVLRYTYGRVWYNEHGIANSSPLLLAGVSNATSNGVQFSLISPEGQNWGWNIGYSDQRVSRAGVRDIDFAAATFGISRQVTPDLKLLVDAGKETDFRPDGTESRLGSTFWDAGFQWSSNLNSLKLMLGHHFFGRSYQLSWTRNAALLSTSLSYIEQPTNLSQQLLGQTPGQIIVSPITGTSLVPSLLNQHVYLMKRASASATYTLPKGNINLTLYDESRDYLTLDNQREKVANASLGWLFELGPFTTLTPNIGWQRYRFLTGQVSYDRFAGLDLVHQINRGNSIRIRLRNDSRSAYATSFTHGSGYRVNVIFAQWTHLF